MFCRIGAYGTRYDNSLYSAATMGNSLYGSRVNPLNDGRVRTMGLRAARGGQAAIADLEDAFESG